MSEQVNGGGAASSEGSAGAGTETEITEQKPDPKVTQRFLDDVKKWQKKATDTEKELNDLKEQRLKESNDYKTLYETEKKNRETLDESFKNFKTAVVFDKKFDVVKQECLKLGLRPEAESDLELLDLAGAVVETTSQGRVLVNGADTLAQEIKKTKPHWFKSASVPQVNAGGAGGGAKAPAELTASYMVELEKKNPSEYRKLFPEYMKQRNSKK
jgi:vacuolar-type H+-ATPase subunit I/STV1